MQTKLNVLVACESSATVRDAFRELGHNAWSCDLLPTKIVPATNGSALHKLPPSKDRWKLRSKTYQGIADAMAEQWSEYLLNQKGN